MDDITALEFEHHALALADADHRFFRQRLFKSETCDIICFDVADDPAHATVAVQASTVQRGNAEIVELPRRDAHLRAVRPDGSDDFAVVTEVDVGPGFDFSGTGSTIIATTQSGEALLISFPSGQIESLPQLGRIASVAFFGR